MKYYKTMEKLAKLHGYVLLENAVVIAQNKSRAFASKEQVRCPCAPFNKGMWCISPECKKHIEEHGECHCGAYGKK